MLKFPAIGLVFAGLMLLVAGAVSSCSSDSVVVIPAPCDAAGTPGLLEQRCGQSGCHGTSPAAGLSLVEGDLAGALSGRASGTCDGWNLVEPGKPEQSLLWLKLYGNPPPCGDLMPLGKALPAQELACVRSWIAGLPAVEPPPGCEMCGGDACLDLDRDPGHCGACGNSCGPGSECLAGACSCAPGLEHCDGSCVDPLSNPDHCGGCGSSCAAGSICNLGQCLCSGGLAACGEGCVELASDAQNCGACGNPCAAAEVCLLGACAAGCGSLDQCGSSCVETTQSVLNCGGCDQPCPSGAFCVDGACSCPAGTASCGGQCLNVLSDPANCGGCGSACGSGLVCDNAVCLCPGGGTACAGTCVDLSQDQNNCGGCGVTCGAGQSCSGGVCQCDGGSVSFSGQIAPALAQGCASRGCHSGVRPQESLNLAAGAAYGQLVGRASSQCNGRLLVEPGSPENSYLMDKLLGVDLCFGTQMPKAGESLPQAQLDAIGTWICNGAPNN